MTADILDEPEGHAELPEHSLLGSYRLVQRLGEGGMGVVHLALDRHGKAVAIKVLRPHVAHDPGARARLSREVETLSRIRSFLFFHHNSATRLWTGSIMLPPCPPV